MKKIEELHDEASQEVDAAELACKTAGYTAESCGDLWNVFDRWLKHPEFLKETTILRAYILGELTTLLGEEVLRERAWDKLTALAKQYSVIDPTGIKASLRIMAFEVFAEPPAVPYNLKLLFSLAHDPITRWAVLDSYQNFPWRLRPHAHKYSNGSVTDQDCDQWLREQGLGKDEFLIHTSESGRDGRIAPATPPTPPGMRLRTGRFQ